jgi:maltooligosyltrehalose trehalohydrolase
MIEPGVAQQTRLPSLGASVHDDSTTTFRVWAPSAESVEVEVATRRSALGRGDDGLFEGRVPGRAGEEYWLVIDGGERLPDPCSRAQPHGLRGPSRIIALERRRDLDRRGVALEDLVLYELHVGTFSAAGTFDGVIARLGELRELGVTAIELMPVATFAGERGWGYDGLYSYAPHPAYGGPEGLMRLLDAAHASGLAVILDVVYNHLGAGSEAVSAFGPYFTDRHQTLWGEAIDYSQPGVREWAIQNAEMWVRDYGFDGLRLDAVHAVFDDGPLHVPAELRDRVKAINPRALVISEMEIGDLRPLEQWRHDAQWADALHHAVHVLLTGEHDGYYAGYGRLEDVARELRRPQGRRLVVCAQNHDQVGNRALGDRLHGRDLRLAAFCTILSPGTPLIFAGEEYDEARPFQYFTNHIDPRIGELTREGRRREFAEFTQYSAAEIPDPEDPLTFERSKLDPTAGDPEHLAYYAELLALRRELPPEPGTIEVDETRGLLRIHRGDFELIANFAMVEQDGVAARSGAVVRR